MFKHNIMMSLSLFLILSRHCEHTGLGHLLLINQFLTPFHNLLREYLIILLYDTNRFEIYSFFFFALV